MNSAPVAFGCILFLLLGYKLYGTLLERKVVKPRAERQTPAHEINDGVDFAPAKPALLFGHHFSSIAGAGPIIGPVVALASFGWMAVAGWILLGNIFIGAVHDYLTLMVSVRNKGSSIADISEKVMGKRAKLIFSLFLWLALVLIIAVFGLSGAKALITKPQMVIPTFGILLVAMVFGWAMQMRGVHFLPGSLVAIWVALGLIGVGYYHPLELPTYWTIECRQMVWFGILIIYCLIASVLPVWLLLRPRDYLSSYKLFIGLFLGIVGLGIANKAINAPPITAFKPLGGELLWPMMFVTVACGAISGFHSLVAGGTTAKQLGSETEGKVVGYGGMILEGILAVVALFCVAAGLYWAGSAPAGMKAEYILQDILNDPEKGGWVVAFGRGFGQIVSALGIPGSLAALFGIIMLKTFILTTLDTSTRLGRFIVAESFGSLSNIFRRRWAGSLLTVVPAALLGYTNGWKAVWPIFGAANQLIAALALLVISSYLVGVRQPTKYTLPPAIFMTLTTIGALIYKAHKYFSAPQIEWTLGIVSLALLVLAGFVVMEALQSYRRLRQPKTEARLHSTSSW